MSRLEMYLITTSALGLLGLAAEDVAANTEAARRAAQRAERMIAGNDYQSAERSLATLDCGGDTGCQTLIDFSYGWLYESWADSDPMGERERLGRAQAYYSRAHKRSPSNIQILNNLALVSRRIGDARTTASAVESAIELDPDSAYERYLFLGDALSSQGDMDEARKAYRRAIKENSVHSEGHQRLLDSYRKTGGYRQLFDYGRRIWQQLPEVAATGFEYSIRLGFLEEPAMAEEALPYWTAVRSDLGSLTQDNLNSLPGPAEWSSQGISELHAIVTSDNEPSAEVQIDWWRETALRQDAMARLLRLKAATIRAAAERKHVTQGERAVAIRLAIKYLTAAVELAPQFYAYLDGGLANSSNAKLDAATDLVALHHTLKAGSDLQSLSGLSESELEEMTDVLFSGKAGAYATGQLDAIQRYHTVLGMLYYETGQLTSGGADNATFQLDHALKTADRIAAEDPTKYQPLPELQVLLADVYRQREMVSDSARVSLDATMGFLETDNLAAASQALRNAQQHGADQKRLASVTTVLTGRAAVKSRGSELLRTDQGTLSEMLGPEIAWLGNPDTLDLPQRFVDGQRFKALTDLGTQLTDAGKSDVARYVYGSALDAANNQKTLNSPADFRRLQNIESGITGSANRVKTPGQLTIDRGARVVPADDDQPGWSLPSTNRKVVLRIDAELLDKDNNVLKKNELPTAPKLDNNNE